MVWIIGLLVMSFPRESLLRFLGGTLAIHNNVVSLGLFRDRDTIPCNVNYLGARVSQVFQFLTVKIASCSDSLPGRVGMELEWIVAITRRGLPLVGLMGRLIGLSTIFYFYFYL